MVVPVDSSKNGRLGLVFITMCVLNLFFVSSAIEQGKDQLGNAI